MTDDFGWVFDPVDEIWRRTPWFCGECGSAQGAQVHTPGKAMGGTWIEGTDYYECTDCERDGVRYVMSDKMLSDRVAAINAAAEREVANAPFTVYPDGTRVRVDLGGREVAATVVGYRRLVNAHWSLTGVVIVRTLHNDGALMLVEGTKLSVAACVLSPA